MKYTIHRATSRGQSEQEWLKSYHSFSFDRYYDPEKMNFGCLQTLNDDLVAPTAGFASHPHSNMEIITLVLEGQLEHKDNGGHHTIISAGEYQVISAGTGVIHSEYNPSLFGPVNFLQIWIIPQSLATPPCYQKNTFAFGKDEFKELISPPNINQQAYLSLAKLSKDKNVSYQLHSKDHGIYLFIIEGEIAINDQKLSKRDAMEIIGTNEIMITGINKSKILLIEIPIIVTKSSA